MISVSSGERNATPEEVPGWSAKLLNVPEYVVVDISNHRFITTRITSDFSDSDLPLLLESLEKMLRPIAVGKLLPKHHIMY
jgi:hypothetical protein